MVLRWELWGGVGKVKLRGCKGAWENLRGDGYIHYLDGSKGFMADTYIKTSIYIH